MKNWVRTTAIFVIFTAIFINAFRYSMIKVELSKNAQLIEQNARLVAENRLLIQKLIELNRELYGQIYTETH